MSDRLPGSSYSNPIWHRGWRIYLNSEDLGIASFTYAFEHDDFDGAEDSNDTRCGHAATVDEAKTEIDEYEDAYALAGAGRGLG